MKKYRFCHVCRCSTPSIDDCCVLCDTDNVIPEEDDDREMGKLFSLGDNELSDEIHWTADIARNTEQRMRDYSD